jgi:hypothetical protein
LRSTAASPSARHIRAGAALVAVLAGLAACARVRPLEGGPADVEPPRLVRAEPADSSVALGRQPRFVLEFSENVAAATVRRGVRFEPPVRLGNVRVDGRKVTIELADSLPPDTTVVLVIGETVQDLVGRDNKLPHEIALTYSTGPALRVAAVAGRVSVRGKTDGRAIVMWQPVPADSGAAARGRHYPTTAVGAEGLFRLGGLPPDRAFRLVAYADQNDNLRGEPEELFAAFPETLRLAAGEIRRGLDWNIVDPNEPSTWTGVALNQTGIPGLVALAVRRVTQPPPADTTFAAPTGRDSVRAAGAVRADTLRPAPLPVAPRTASPWAAARARLEPHGFVRSEWSVVYASPRGDYSMRVAPGRVVWLAFVDARRDSVPGLFVSADSTHLAWEPLVVGDTLEVLPGARVRRRAIELQ